MRRACVFAHYDRQNVVDPHVVFLLNNIRKVCERIVFVSTSALSDLEQSKLTDVVDDVILRENIGHDFGSYQKGLLLLQFMDYDEILIANDSVYGPLKSLTTIFEEMSGVDCDAWSATSNWAISYHLQSYFIVFRRRILEQTVFWRFWRNVRPQRNKAMLIRVYEVGLSRLLIRLGFRLTSYLPPARLIHGFIAQLIPQEVDVRHRIVQRLHGEWVFMIYYFMIDRIIAILRVIALKDRGLYKSIMGMHRINPTHTLWSNSLQDGKLIFLKVDLIRDKYGRRDVRNFKQYLEKYSDYRSQLVLDHLRRVRGK
jgi:lipopolysaccharide biosynthesis protein